ncbi:unnamed protein product [Caenorhabditis angaria]|uniref:Uncharacterized protein n=1 Tax=Caenorhabditis angaria TaxID=860376 RepID=A0A9P1MTJ3_9PELO|nr:unnamed protein product [Caenorhabditis angaria]
MDFQIFISKPDGSTPYIRFIFLYPILVAIFSTIYLIFFISCSIWRCSIIRKQDETVKRLSDRNNVAISL